MGVTEPAPPVLRAIVVAFSAPKLKDLEKVVGRGRR